ncbi:hypothetical protein glysoja_010721, partial [Glycine soja]
IQLRWNLVKFRLRKADKAMAIINTKSNRANQKAKLRDCSSSSNSLSGLWSI